METLAFWLILACLAYSLLFIIVFNGIYFYEEGGFSRVYDFILNRLNRLEQSSKELIKNFLKDLSMLRKLLLK